MLLMSNVPLAIAMIVENDNTDGDFFGFLYHEYHREVYRLSLKIVGNSLDAEDVTQTTFLKIYKSIEKFRDLPPMEIAPLIVVYSRNAAKDFMRKKRRHVILLRYRYGLSEKETADAMSMSETAVSSCLLRAKKTLRKKMGGKL